MKKCPRSAKFGVFSATGRPAAGCMLHIPPLIGPGRAKLHVAYPPTPPYRVLETYATMIAYLNFDGFP